MPKSLRLALLLLPASASPLWAAEGGLLSVNTGLMFWTVVVFLTVLALLYKLAFPHILGAVEAREARIRELLAAAARDREEAHALLEQQRAELEQMRARSQEAFAETRAAAERMREELLAQARHDRDELMARAQREIQQQVEHALDQVRRDAVELALAAASRLVERNVDAADNRRLVQDYLGQLEQQGAPVAAGV